MENRFPSHANRSEKKIFSHRKRLRDKTRQAGESSCEFLAKEIFLLFLLPLVLSYNKHINTDNSIENFSVSSCLSITSVSVALCLVQCSEKSEEI
jgi:hypothetical protein